MRNRNSRLCVTTEQRSQTLNKHNPCMKMSGKNFARSLINLIWMRPSQAVEEPSRVPVWDVHGKGIEVSIDEVNALPHTNKIYYKEGSVRCPNIFPMRTSMYAMIFLWAEYLSMSDNICHLNSLTHAWGSSISLFHKIANAVIRLKNKVTDVDDKTSQLKWLWPDTSAERLVINGADLF